MTPITPQKNSQPRLGVSAPWIDGLVNARDLGGLMRADGGLTPTGVFVRAEALDEVTARGWEQLAAHGVRAIIDLRRPKERSGAPPAGFTVARVDLDGDDAAFWGPREADGTWGTPLYYLDYLASQGARMREALDALAAAPDGGVLFHCAAGWDRTGLMAAMLLRAVGVTTEAAAVDYAASFDNADAYEALHGRSSHAAMRLGLLRELGRTPRSAFGEVYEGIDPLAWFEAAGVSAATRAAVCSWRGALAAP